MDAMAKSGLSSLSSLTSNDAPLPRRLPRDGSLERNVEGPPAETDDAVVARRGADIPPRRDEKDGDDDEDDDDERANAWRGGGVGRKSDDAIANVIATMARIIAAWVTVGAGDAVDDVVLLQLGDVMVVLFVIRVEEVK